MRKLFRKELCVLRHITTVKEVLLSTAQLPRGYRRPGCWCCASCRSYLLVHDLHRLSCIERCTRAHQEAGVLSYLALHLLISLSFRKCGSIPGNNVLSVLSRANYLDEKDLDSAAYELDQLQRLPRSFFVTGFRRLHGRLEVQHTLEVCQSDAYVLNIIFTPSR